jgi:hypothetical protein
LIRLESNNKNDLLNDIPKKIELLAHLTVGSEAIIKTYYGREGENQQRKRDNINTLVAKGSAIESLGAHSTYPNENILILGAGRVSASVAEYIGRTSHRQVIVASADKHEVAAVARYVATSIAQIIKPLYTSAAQLYKPALRYLLWRRV